MYTGSSNTYIDALSAQDFGARDPTAGEIASNFTDKVLGNADTSHIIRQATCFPELALAWASDQVL